MERINLESVYDYLKTLDEKELKKLVIRLLEENELLKKDILIDNLTNIYNRKILNNRLKYDVLVMCDIDNFKTINDTYGHQTGDELLKTIAKNLSKILRNEDTLLRYGGDEFTILFKNCTMEDIKRKLDKVKENKFSINDSTVTITMSFGITEYTEGKGLEEAISEADQALYESKKLGKNKVTIYKKENNKELKKTI